MGRDQGSLPSTSTLAGVIVLLNTAGFGFAAYQCNEDPKLEKSVADLPVFGSVVVATKDLMLSAGVLKPPVEKKSEPSTVVVNSAVSQQPSTKVKKQEEEPSKEKKEMHD